jgi:hypothetical protein
MSVNGKVECEGSDPVSAWQAHGVFPARFAVRRSSAQPPHNVILGLAAFGQRCPVLHLSQRFSLADGGILGTRSQCCPGSAGLSLCLRHAFAPPSTCRGCPPSNAKHGSRHDAGMTLHFVCELRACTPRAVRWGRMTAASRVGAAGGWFKPHSIQRHAIDACKIIRTALGQARG